jgi:hypothetical protein
MHLSYALPQAHAEAGGPVLAGYSIAGEELSSVGSRHPERDSGFRRTPFRTLKTAVLAPIPMDSVTRATNVKRASAAHAGSHA